MTLLGILLFIVPALFGISVLLATHTAHEKIGLIAMGTTGGIVAATSLLYVASLFIAPAPLWMWIVVIALAAATGWIGSQHLTHFWQLPWDRTRLIVLIATSALALLLVPNLLFVDSGGGLSTSLTNAWGDMGWHMSNVTLFAEGQTVPPENPIFAGERLTYPFLINFFSGLLIATGATPVEAMVAPALLFIPIFFTLFFIFAHSITNRPTAAIVALLLLIFSGSTLGWLDLRADLAESGMTLIEFLSNLPRDYTGHSTNESGFHFLNILLAGLLPQRSLLFGLPLALSILLMLTEGLKRERTEYFVLAGVGSGLMPLAHAHTVIALVPPIIGLFGLDMLNKKHRRLGASSPWVIFALVAASIGLPEVLYYFVGGAASGGTFLSWAPGWTSAGHNFIWFWIKNTGILIPLGVIGFLMRGPRLAKLFAGSGLLLLLAANLFSFAPWPWDNYKILLLWLIFTLPIVGLLAARGLRDKRIWVVAITMVLILVHGQVAVVDLVRTISPDAPQFGEWDADMRAFADEIQTHTTRDDTLITAPYHNNPVALAGRPLYLGFIGHVWSHGENPYEREQHVRSLYTRQIPRVPAATTNQFVVVGPVERQQFPGLTIQDTWESVAAVGPHELYRIK